MTITLVILMPVDSANAVKLKMVVLSFRSREATEESYTQRAFVP